MLKRLRDMEDTIYRTEAPGKGNKERMREKEHSKGQW